MSILSGVSDFFGLDIGTAALRVVQLRGNGTIKTLEKYGALPLDSKLLLSESAADQQKVIDGLKQLLAETGIVSKNVAVGLASQRVFTTVVDIDRLPNKELAKSIKYQADSLIPTPMAESKIDWAVLGDSPKDPNKVELLLSSIPNSFIEARLDALEAIGLNVIAFEPDNLALARSLIAPDATQPQMAIDMGNLATDLNIMMNGAPRLLRSIPTGTDSLVKAAMQNLNIDNKQAEQFVFKFGMSKDKLEGQIYQAISGSIEMLTAEIDKSIKFFHARYPNTKLDRIIVTGGASALPEFPLFLANKCGVDVEIGNAWRNIAFPQQRQNELLAVSNHYAVAAGLAERKE